MVVGVPASLGVEVAVAGEPEARSGSGDVGSCWRSAVRLGCWAEH